MQPFPIRHRTPHSTGTPHRTSTQAEDAHATAPPPPHTGTAPPRCVGEGGSHGSSSSPVTHVGQQVASPHRCFARVMLITMVCRASLRSTPVMISALSAALQLLDRSNLQKMCCCPLMLITRARMLRSLLCSAYATSIITLSPPSRRAATELWKLHQLWDAIAHRGCAGARRALVELSQLTLLPEGPEPLLWTSRVSLAGRSMPFYCARMPHGGLHGLRRR